MSKKLQELRALRDKKAREANDLNNKHPGDKVMPKADSDALNALLDQIDQIDDDIKREERLIQAAADDPATQEHNAANAAMSAGGARPSAESEAMRAYLRGGIGALSDEQRRTVTNRLRISDASSHAAIQAAMSTTTGSEGGYIVGTQYMTTLAEALRSYGGIRAAATTMTTDNGQTMNFPAADATAEEGELLAENGEVSTGDTTFASLALSTYMFSSKDIAIPWQLLSDSVFDVEAYITALLQVRLGRITSRFFTTGTGSSQPRGIVTASSAGKIGTTGQTATVTYDDLVDLEHSVDPAYRVNPGVGWMFNDSTLKVIRKIKDGNGRPIFVPGYEYGNPGGAPDRLMNKPIFISQEMAGMAANAKSILFGDFQKYVIRDVMDLMLFRMTDSAFTRKAQTGFLAFMRSGGNLIDVGGAVKHYQNSAT